jgi:hypothetical protein
MSAARHDIAMGDIVEVMLSVNAQAFAAGTALHAPEAVIQHGAD